MIADNSFKQKGSMKYLHQVYLPERMMYDPSNVNNQ